VKMMVVKEPHEMSEAVKNYPTINWKLPGMRPLQVGLVVSAIVTSLAGILSNPLFTLSTNSVNSTPILQSALITQEIPHNTIQVSAVEDLIKK
ncbi:MAG: NAD(P)H-quinone oxidoreductase subunit N, partial [Waterburya sp.]